MFRVQRTRQVKGSVGLLPYYTTRPPIAGERDRSAVGLGSSRREAGGLIRASSRRSTATSTKVPQASRYFGEYSQAKPRSGHPLSYSRVPRVYASGIHHRWGRSLEALITIDAPGSESSPCASLTELFG